MKTAVFVILVVLISSQPLKAQANGLLVYKERGYQQDSQAICMEYSEYQAHPSITNVTTAQGSQIRIMPGQSPTFIPYASDSNISSTTALPLVQKAIQKYPQLKERLTKIEKQWISRNSIEEEKKKSAPTPSPTPFIELFSFTDKSGNAHKDVSIKINDDGSVGIIGTEAVRTLKLCEIPSESDIFGKGNAIKVKAVTEKLTARVLVLEKEVEQLQATTVNLQESLSAKSVIAGEANTEERKFLLKRKLPKANFSQLYDIGSYVFECITLGDEMCVLVSNNLSSLEDRFINLWVRAKGDIDVTLRSGDEERIPVYVEVEDELSERLNAREATKRAEQIKVQEFLNKKSALEKELKALKQNLGI